MRSIAIINQKGGVGKTTTAVNLAAALSELGSRVCLIDLDPQAHASLHLGVSLTESEASLYDVLTGEQNLADVRREATPNLWIVPSHLDLAAIELQLANQPNRECVLKAQMAADTETFDYVIFDCPPSLGILTLNALTAVNEIVLPMQPHFLALHGLSKLLGTINVVAQRFNPALTLAGVVFCMYDAGTRLASEVCSDVSAFFAANQRGRSPWANARAFDARIRRNIRLAEAPSFGQSILEYASSSHGAADYRALAIELAAARPATTRRAA